jgi:hypothetical protein
MHPIDTDRHATVNQVEDAFRRNDLREVERIVRSGVLQSAWCDMCGRLSADDVCPACVERIEGRHVAQATTEGTSP